MSGTKFTLDRDGSGKFVFDQSVISTANSTHTSLFSSLVADAKKKPRKNKTSSTAWWENIKIKLPYNIVLLSKTW